MDDATLKVAELTRRTEKVFGRIAQQVLQRLTGDGAMLEEGGRSGGGGRRSYRIGEKKSWT